MGCGKEKLGTQLDHAVRLAETRHACAESGLLQVFTIATRARRACMLWFSIRPPLISAGEFTLSKDMVPKRIFLTKGVGKHKERLTSFELALRDAGIAAQNLVRVSSIFPPNCKLIPRKEGLPYLSAGEVTFAVVAENSTREPHRLTASSIGLAIPADRSTTAT